MSEWVSLLCPSFTSVVAKGGLQGPMLYRVHGLLRTYVP